MAGRNRPLKESASGRAVGGGGKEKERKGKERKTEAQENFREAVSRDIRMQLEIGESTCETTRDRERERE